MEHESMFTVTKFAVKYKIVSNKFIVTLSIQTIQKINKIRLRKYIFTKYMYWLRNRKTHLHIY